MSCSATWNCWRRACLPHLELFPVRTVESFAYRGSCSVRNPSRNLRQVRHVAYSVPRLTASSTSGGTFPDHKEIKDRKDELDNSSIEQYPRGPDGFPELDVASFQRQFAHLGANEVAEDHGQVTIAGRISSIRRSGGKLAFVDLVEEPSHSKVQVLLNLGQMQDVSKKSFSDRVKLVRRGDNISARGVPCRTSSGELSIRASALPAILSPCLHTIPLTTVEHRDSSSTDLLARHVEMLAEPSIIETIVARAEILRSMRSFFESRSFCEVQTPILAAAAGGANAKPFETVATEFLDRKLSLRVAPELWLKRLVLGGMPRVFEIGPSFRNEGLDKTHNPEFTTCEFYAVYHTLPQLQRMTESLLRNIAAVVGKTSDRQESSHLASHRNPALFAGRFREIDFIPAINSHLSHPLPNLSSPTARTDVLSIFSTHSLPLPSKPTLPRLLDKLCSHFLEPTADLPTWIINTPECLSPLAKSFIHPTAPNSQPVAARAELFIGSRELVNCYEEENSPFEQRRKFIEQRKHALLPNNHAGNAVEDEEAMKIDEDYLRALEWGLPPTGGWGCGIDRLVMLFTGKERIEDVLSFGNLRAVTRGAEKTDKNKD